MAIAAKQVAGWGIEGRGRSFERPRLHVDMVEVRIMRGEILRARDGKKGMRERCRYLTPMPIVYFPRKVCRDRS